MTTPLLPSYVNGAWWIPDAAAAERAAIVRDASTGEPVETGVNHAPLT